MNNILKSALNAIAEADQATIESIQTALDNRTKQLKYNYEEDLKRKKESLETRAEKAKQQSEARLDSALSITRAIPPGQPILVGHHSEGKHRRALKQSDNSMRQSIKEAEKAEYYERRAESVGSAGIASNDPEAVKKLKEKLKILKNNQEVMKAVRAAERKAKKRYPDNINDQADYIAELVNLPKFTPEKMIMWMKNKPHYHDSIFPEYMLKNNNANIKRVESRLKEQQNLLLVNTDDIERDNYKVTREDGRVLFIFDSKPDYEIRKIIKSYGFVWAPSRAAWVRKITVNTEVQTKNLVNALDSAYKG